jgi:hypothetical protein
VQSTIAAEPVAGALIDAEVEGEHARANPAMSSAHPEHDSAVAGRVLSLRTAVYERTHGTAMYLLRDRQAHQGLAVNWLCGDNRR